MLSNLRGSRVSLVWCCVAALALLLVLREMQHRQPTAISRTAFGPSQSTPDAIGLNQSQAPPLPSADEAEPQNPLNVAYVTMYTETVRTEEDSDKYNYDEDHYFIAIRML